MAAHSRGCSPNCCSSAGPADRALAALDAASLTPRARLLADRLAETVAAIRARAPSLKLTVDPVEFRGFRYHTGLSLTVYAPGRSEELGRGGRYVCGEAEPATGLTLYPDAILRAAPPRSAKPRVYLPPGADHAQGAALRAQGYATVPGLDAGPGPHEEARRLACSHIYIDGALAAVTE